MAQYPTITIKLLNKPAPGKISIYIGGLTLSLTSTHSTPGHKQWQSDNPPSHTMTLQDSVRQLYNAFNNYYPPTGIYSAIRVGAPVNNSVTIEWRSYTMGNFSFSTNNPEDYEVTVTPVIAPDVFGITGVTYAPAIGNKCDNVLVWVSVENGTAPYRITSYYNGGHQEEKEVDEDGLFIEFPRDTAGPRQVQVSQVSNLPLVRVKNVPIISKLLGVN